MALPAILATARYVSLATRRRDGRLVPTPVWLATTTDGVGWVFSAGDAGKVKRLRNFPGVRLAACSFRGAPRSAWLDAEARIVTDPARIAQAYAALRAKYGLAMRVADLLSHLSGRHARRAMIEIRA
jgi:PPOX class probable F420-dependent enzyme